ncbi:MAG: glycosyltransferase family 4 protein [Deltaproteobacteria bacterium]|nr:glycosyltransferase family 4 protein [Deltaproteobacteria bacterium]
MRVLLINQAFYPDTVATAQHTTDLAQFLASRGHAVSVLCSRRAYSQPDKIFSRTEDFDGIHIVRARGTGFGKGSFLFRVVDIFTLQVAFLFRLLTFSKQDVVIAFTSPPLVSFLAWLYCRLRGARLVSWLMDINPDAAIAVGYLSPMGLVSRILLRILKFTLAKSDSVVVLDRWMKERVIAKGVAAAKVVVVPPWDIQDPAAFDQPNIRGPLNPFRRENGLEGKFVVLYSGNLSIVHPLDTLLKAAVRLKDDASTEFLFIGGGLRTSDVDHTREKYRLKNLLQLPYQPRTRLPFSLSCADVHVIVLGEKVSGLVHTSKVYGTLMAGVPFIVVAPKESHLGDLVGVVPGGFQVEHGDVDGFLRSLASIRELSDDDRAVIRLEQRRYLLKNFALQELLTTFEEAAITRPLPSPDSDSIPGFQSSHQRSR